MPQVSLHRGHNRSWSLFLYEFSYVIEVGSFGADDRQWKSYVQIPSKGIPKPIKVVLDQKYRDVGAFLRGLKPKTTN